MNKPHKQFLKEFQRKLPKFKILKFDNFTSSLIFEDEAGNKFEKSQPGKLFQNKSIKFYSLAQNKIKFTQYKINLIHDSLKLNKIEGRMVEVEDIRGFVFRMGRNDLLNGFKPNVESCITPELYLRYKFNIVHNNFYNYGNFKYKDGKGKIEIKCPIHGTFPQTIESHLSGTGCRKCVESGFTLKSWLVRCKYPKSTLYILKMYNQKEEFIKVGITNQKIEDRYKGLKEYKFEVIFSTTGNNSTIFMLEKNLLSLYKNYKYLPHLKFGGYTECFSKELINNKLIINY